MVVVVVVQLVTLLNDRTKEAVNQQKLMAYQERLQRDGEVHPLACDAFLR
jgi:hypothetical protein